MNMLLMLEIRTMDDFQAWLDSASGRASRRHIPLEPSPHNFVVVIAQIHRHSVELVSGHGLYSSPSSINTSVCIDILLVIAERPRSAA